MRFHKSIIAFSISFIFLLNILTVSGFEVRPAWLIDQNDMSSAEWPLDADYANKDSWYVGFNAPNDAFISVQPILYSSADSAINKVHQANTTAYDVLNTGQLFYAFPNFRFNLNVVSSGFAWEIKSPCCYSRGVSFSIANIYINIFGSQQSKWADVVYIYDKQVVKIQQNYNITVSNEMIQEINAYESSFLPNNPLVNINSSQIAGIFLLIVLPSVAVILTSYSSIKSKLMNRPK